MTARWGPEYELKAVVVAALRNDDVLTALLFPPDAPASEPTDRRIYESDVYLPPELRYSLPRILVEVDGDSANWEQDDPAGDLGPATVRLHHFVPEDDRERIEDLAKRTTQVMATLRGSTPFEGDRIIAAELVKSGPRIKGREPAFNDAYRLTETYISRMVGVIA